MNLVTEGDHRQDEFFTRARVGVNQYDGHLRSPNPKLEKT